MAYPYNPTRAEKRVLAQIRNRESSNNYQAQNPQAGSTASGAYQFIDETWQSITQITGEGQEYSAAYLAPHDPQNSNGLWLLRQYGPNSPYSWQASGPYQTIGLPPPIASDDEPAPFPKRSQ